MHDVFISHAPDDTEIAVRLERDLNTRGFKVILQRDVAVGPVVSAVENVERTLTEAKNVLVLLSPAHTSSPWMQHELEMAYLLESEGHTRVIPVLVSDTHSPLFLRSKLHIDLRENYPAGLDSITQMLLGKPKSSTQKRAERRKIASELFQVLISLAAAGVSAAAALTTERNVFSHIDSTTIIAVLVGTIAVTIPVIIVYMIRSRKRSSPLQILVGNLQQAYLEALNQSQLNPLTNRERDRG